MSFGEQESESSLPSDADADADDGGCWHGKGWLHARKRTRETSSSQATANPAAAAMVTTMSGVDSSIGCHDDEDSLDSFQNCLCFAYPTSH